MRDPQEVLDDYLVLRCQGGERGAFELLANRWHPKLVRYACRTTGSVDEASDLVQDAWISIARGIRRLKDPGRFRGWVYQIVTNKCRDWIRRRQRDRARSSEIVAEPIDPATVDASDQKVLRVRTALRRLAPERRVLLSMYYLEGFSVSEMGKILEIPPGTVKSRLFRARQELRAEMED